MSFVQFTDVGRDRVSWLQEMDHGPEDPRFLVEVERAARKGGRIASVGLDADWITSVREHGTLCVGGCRMVGAFRVLTAAMAGKQTTIDGVKP